MATDIRIKENLPLLTERIVDTYAEVGSINHLGHCPLPNYDTIIAVAQKIPEDVLQEDAKLLMWYDQALTRTES